MKNKTVQVPLEELIENWDKDPLMMLELQNMYFIQTLSPHPMVAYRIGEPPDAVYYWQTNFKEKK